MRTYMDIKRKYITECVMEDVDVSKYAVNDFWTYRQWGKYERTINTILEAIHKLHQDGIPFPTRPQISAVSGLSVSTIGRRLKEVKKLMNVQQRYDESN